MKVEKIPINKVKTYENNAKIHTERQIEQIKKSIQDFGNNDPIAIDEDGVIIEGHGRYLALKELGFEEALVIKLTHLSEEQRKAYALIHNKLTVNTNFDFDKLNSELGSIPNIDMQAFDFELELEIDYLAADDEEQDDTNNSKEIGEEEFDDESFKNECPRCKFKWND